MESNSTGPTLSLSCLKNITHLSQEHKMDFHFSSLSKESIFPISWKLQKTQSFLLSLLPYWHFFFLTNSLLNLWLQTHGFKLVHSYITIQIVLIRITIQIVLIYMIIQTVIRKWMVSPTSKPQASTSGFSCSELSWEWRSCARLIRMTGIFRALTVPGAVLCSQEYSIHLPLFT